MMVCAAHVRIRIRTCVVLVLVSFVLCLIPRVAQASGAANSIVFDDRADLLSHAEEKRLSNDYGELLEYMDAAFASTDAWSGSAESYARQFVQRRFGSRAGVVFLIDMYHREIYVYANEAGLRLISTADARAITDNAYQMATRGEYYRCADSVFSQILTKCGGGRIARPVKHITNLLIAAMLSIIVTFDFAIMARSKDVDDSDKRRKALVAMPRLLFKKPVVTHTEVVTHSDNSGAGFDAGSGGGGGGGGGGGSSGGGGGGGGHAF